MIAVLIQLTSAGADTGPFTISSDGESPAFSVVLATVSKAALLTGITVNVQDDTTVVRVTSTGTCTNYQDVLINTPAATTTTTSTAVVAPATVTIDNNSVDLSISNVLVGGAGITDASFSVNTTEETFGYTSNLGTVTVTVISSGVAASQSIKVTDSSGAVSCLPFIGGGSYQFFNQIVNNSFPVQIVGQNTPCSETVTVYPFTCLYELFSVLYAGEGSVCDGTSANIYAIVPTPTVGDIFYEDAALTIPWNAAEVVYIESLATSYYVNISSGLIVSSGAFTCPTTTTTTTVAPTTTTTTTTV